MLSRSTLKIGTLGLTSLLAGVASVALAAKPAPEQLAGMKASADARAAKILSSLVNPPSPSSDPNAEDTLFVAAKSTEATLSFEHFVLIESRTKPSKDTANEKIEAQLVHLFGPMGEAVATAVPKGDHTVRITGIEKSDTGVWKASYQYEGTAQVSNKAERAYGKGKYRMILPLNPDTIYDTATNIGLDPSCTDEHYRSRGDFWYFWNPLKSECKALGTLKEGRDYSVVEATMVRQENTKKTYPEYAKLVDSDGVIRMSIFLGLDEVASNLKKANPWKSRDINSDNYRSIQEQLVNMGFESRVWTDEEIKDFVKNSGVTPYVEELTQSYHAKGAKKDITVRVRMFFGPTGIDEPNKGFHYLYKDSLEKDAILVYDGHSGLGGHLDLDAIEQAEGFKVAINPHKYQIYFFNSCTSYTYYNTQYFSRKKTKSDPAGTKSLDVFTNGLATLFSVMHDTNTVLVKAVDSWARSLERFAREGKAMSYQEMAKEIDSNNLFGINGDQDNPTTAEEAARL